MNEKIKKIVLNFPVFQSVDHLLVHRHINWTPQYNHHHRSKGVQEDRSVKIPTTKVSGLEHPTLRVDIGKWSYVIQLKLIHVVPTLIL